jgi:hypothetical protein
VNDRDLPLEERLRAHFADRSGREPLPPAGLPPTEGAAPEAPPWWRRPTLLVAAAGLLVLTGIATAVAVGDDDPEDLASVGGDTTTSSSAVPWGPEHGTTTSTSPTSTSTTLDQRTSPGAGVTVVVAPDGILGWWEGSRWIRGDSGATPPVSGGETYTLVQLGSDGATAVGSAPEPGCEFRDPRPILVDLGLDEPAEKLTVPPIGVLGVDDPHPRPVTELGEAGQYVGIAQELLAARGVGADGATVRVVRADLGGNGTDEVLLAVERLTDARGLFAGEGDFSLLVLRQVVDGDVQTTVLHESISEGAPGDPVTPFVEVGRVAAVADLNGDGRMEVVVQRDYYEGQSTEVWESDPSGGVHRILDVGCGV